MEEFWSVANTSNTFAQIQLLAAMLLTAQVISMRAHTHTHAHTQTKNV